MPPFLICMHGLSGSGKTTVAKALTGAFSASLFRSDVERKRLFGLTPLSNSHDTAINLYSKSATRKTFQRLHHLADGQLAQEQGAILDAAFLKVSERQKMHALAIRHSVPFFIVNCLATDAVLYDRIKKRRHIGNDASEATEAIIVQQKGWQESFTEEEKPYTINVFTEEIHWSNKLIQTIRQSLQG